MGRPVIGSDIQHFLIVGMSFFFFFFFFLIWLQIKYAGLKTNHYLGYKCRVTSSLKFSNKKKKRGRKKMIDIRLRNLLFFHCVFTFTHIHKCTINVRRDFRVGVLPCIQAHWAVRGLVPCSRAQRQYPGGELAPSFFIGSIVAENPKCSRPLRNAVLPVDHIW